MNPLHATDFFWYPLKTSENQIFSHVFKGYQKRLVTEKELKNLHPGINATETTVPSSPSLSPAEVLNVSFPASVNTSLVKLEMLSLIEEMFSQDAMFAFVFVFWCFFLRGNMYNSSFLYLKQKKRNEMKPKKGSYI